MLGAAPYTLQIHYVKSVPSELTSLDGDSLTLSRSCCDESGSTAQTQQELVCHGGSVPAELCGKLSKLLMARWEAIWQLERKKRSEPTAEGGSTESNVRKQGMFSSS